jgi:hypothetical protein
MPARLKPLLLAIAAGLVVAFGSTSSAGAAVPCWKALINDWFDGRIDHVYAPACYRQAIAHLPQDVASYSSARDDIERAELAAIRYNRGSGPSDRGGTTTTPSGGGPIGGGNSDGGSSAPQEQSRKGVITRAIEWLGPSNAGSVPLPLLILAGVAFLLLAAAGGSFLNRRFRERRLPPPPT